MLSAAELRPLAEIVDYDSMIAAMRARAAERKLALSASENAVVAGLPDKYLQKLIGSLPVRRLGMASLGPVLSVLGIKLIMVEDADAERRYGPRLKRHNPRLIRTGTEARLAERHVVRMGRKGGRARWAGTTAQERSEAARKLNQLRWRRPKITEIKRAAT
jgi:hypothetical protein